MPPKPSRPSVVSKKRKSSAAKSSLLSRQRTIDFSFKLYIYKVLKDRTPGMSISQKALATMDDFIKDMFKIIATEAGMLVTKGNRVTLQPWDIEAAVRLCMSGELALHAVSEGTKAYKRFKDSK